MLFGAHLGSHCTWKICRQLWPKKMFQSLLYHFQISSYQRKSISSHSICTISCSYLFLFKSVMYQFLKTTVCNILMKKGSVFQNIGQNNLCLFLPHLISITCSHLHVKNYWWSDPPPGSGASFMLRLVLAYIFVCQSENWHGNSICPSRVRLSWWWGYWLCRQ